jgi:predicted nucleic acid-binding protein
LNYIDTSALLKWYLPERGSTAFGAWIATQDEARISPLTRVEVRATIARKQRNRELGATDARRAVDAFLADLDDGLFIVHPLAEPHWAEAEALLDALADLPLRTLDALHLACARVEQARVFATADLKLAAAARQLGMITPTFDR